MSTTDFSTPAIFFLIFLTGAVLFFRMLQRQEESNV
jgi:hypothetical protein